MVNASYYKQWLELQRFRLPMYAVTFIDLEIIINNVLKDYKLSTNADVREKMEDMFIGEYLDYVNNDYYYKVRCKEIGQVAFKMLKNNSDWLNYNNEVAFYDLLTRCIAYNFKNSASIKNLVKQYKLCINS